MLPLLFFVSALSLFLVKQQVPVTNDTTGSGQSVLGFIPKSALFCSPLRFVAPTTPYTATIPFPPEPTCSGRIYLPIQPLAFSHCPKPKLYIPIPPLQHVSFSCPSFPAPEVDKYPPPLFTKTLETYFTGLVDTLHSEFNAAIVMPLKASSSISILIRFATDTR
jgi:hypothetical protein